MEDFSIRAIVIGVSLFVTMLTLSAIIIYYNTARSVADVVTNRADIAFNLEQIEKQDNFEGTLSGVEVRSLIRKYAGNSDVKINIVKISGIDTNKYNDVGNSWFDENIIMEDKLNMIEPVSNNFAVKSVDKKGITTINLSLNVD